MESWARDKFTTRRHLYVLERQLVTWYDDQTALDAINDDILKEQRRLGALQSRLQLLREKNNLSLAKLELQGRKQAVPHSIAKAMLDFLPSSAGNRVELGRKSSITCPQ
jgi:hypothetical protein